MIIAIITIVLTMVGIICLTAWLCKSPKYKNGMTYVAKEFTNTLNEAINAKNNIEYCPHCGSHDIKIYRKGYNYHKGFWLRMFDIKGGGYIAGMDANKACCRCMDCGNDWETDYDYRLINK